jgi:hypothetical protein
VPILDGLDEMPAGQHPAAIDALDRVPPGRPLVVTCRSAEYEAAVTSSGRLLATAAVVELEPVEVQEAIAFLSVGGVADDRRWAPVLAFLREHPTAPLAATLSSPLMVAQARTVYSDPATDPAELLARERFADRAAIEDHLLNAFIPAVYRHHLHPPTTDRARRRIPRYPPELAHRWLTFLARHLDSRATRELVWWQLHSALASRTRRVIGLLLELVTGFAAGLGVAVGVGLEVGVVAGLAGGFGAGLVAVPPSHPGHVNIQIRGRLRLLGRKLILGLAVGLMTGTGNRHPNRSPQVRTITVPGSPPRLRTGLLGGDRHRLPWQAHPTSTPHTRFVFLGTQVSPRASSRPHLTMTPLPPARGQHHLFPQGTPTPKQSPMLGTPRERAAPLRRGGPSS